MAAREAARISPEIEKKICDFYRAGNSMEKASHEFFVSQGCVKEILDRRKVPIRTNVHRTNMSKEEVIRLAKQEFDHGLSFKEIGEKLNKNPEYIRNLINARNEESREEIIERNLVRVQPKKLNFPKVVHEGKVYIDITEAILYSNY